jgi:hypothetical protein
MAQKVPKLQIRQKSAARLERTPPGLIQWDLNDLDSARWQALNSHLKVFQSRPRPFPSSNFSPRFPEIPTDFPPQKSEKLENHQNLQKKTEKEISPKKKTQINRSSTPTQSLRPAMMPSLDVQHSSIPSQGRSLLEKAEILSASEAIDQESLRYQVKLRKNVELIHEEDLKLKDLQWKERLAKKREELESLQKREHELKEVVKKYSGKKENESEASKELARLIEAKARIKDDINLARLKKVDLENTINELHVELAKDSILFENQEKNLLNDLESLKRQVEMSENEKLDTVAFTKENLARKKNDLEMQRLALVEKWQMENKEFKGFFQQTDQKRAEIRKQIQFLKNEKEKLGEELKNYEARVKEFEEEKMVEENNKKTVALAKMFQEFKDLNEFQELSLVVKSTAKKMIDKGFDEISVERDGSDLGEFLQQVKARLMRRKTEIAENAEKQVKLIEDQINEAEKVAIKTSKLFQRQQK